jgi:hypothetical protein
MLGRFLGAPGIESATRQLDGFVDSLLQAFENSRPGLTDEMIDSGPAVERFFLDVYERELPRLKDTIRLTEPHLSEAARAEYVRQVDEHVRKVVIPAYLRIAGRFTSRERNEFYLVPELWHGAERAGWTLGGILTGSFVLWAPFIPIWDKYIVLPFALAGLFLPNIRKVLALKRYERDLNRIVAGADREISRIDLHYLTAGELGVAPPVEPADALRARSAAAQAQARKEPG